MKRTIISMLLVFAAAQFAFAQQAQPKPATDKEKARAEQRAFMDAKLDIIKNQLELTGEQFEKFAPIYREYTRNINSNRRKTGKIDVATASKQEINEYLRNRIDNNINVGMVRKVYIQIFERVLTPQQLYKLYKIDDKLSRQARAELKKRQEAK